MEWTQLATELQLQIFSHLSLEDLKSVCLVHSRFRSAAQTHLFHDIVLSKTKLDLHRFLAIANTPRLAGLPRRLVWYELVQDDDSIQQILEDSKDETHKALEAIAELTKTAFWTVPYKAASEHSHFFFIGEAGDSYWAEEYTGDRGVAKVPVQVQQDIAAALKKLVGVDTFVAQPMPFGRVLAVAEDGSNYSLDSGLMRFQDKTSEPCQTDGLFLLCPDFLGDQLGSQLRSLYLGGSFARADNFARLKDNHTLWSNITTLDLNVRLRPPPLPGRGNSSRSMHGNLVQCLLRADKLRHVHLAFDAVPEAETMVDKGLALVDILSVGAGGTPSTTTGPFASSQHEPHSPLWPNLEYFGLTDARCATCVLVDFVRNHAQTLRRLFFCECNFMDGEMVHALAGIEGLRLESFRVLHESAPVADHASLLEFVNRQPPSCTVATREEAPVDIRGPCFQTEEPVYDWTVHPRMAYFDLAAESQSHGSMVHDYRTKSRTWPYRRSTYPPEAQAAIAEWAVEREQEDVDMQDEVPETRQVFDSPEEAKAARKRAAAAKAADRRQTRRGETAPYWRWHRTNAMDPRDRPTIVSGADMPRIYCWQTKDPTGQNLKPPKRGEPLGPPRGHPTVAWNFYREFSDGAVEKAFGQDPLEYFSDWDSVGEEEDDDDDDDEEEEEYVGVMTRSRAKAAENKKKLKETGPSAYPATPGPSGHGQAVPSTPADLCLPTPSQVPVPLRPAKKKPLDLVGSTKESKSKAPVSADDGPHDGPPQVVRMWSEPSFYSKAFQDFAEEEDDMGHLLEDGVDLVEFDEDKDAPDGRQLWVAGHEGLTSPEYSEWW